MFELAEEVGSPVERKFWRLRVTPGLPAQFFRTRKACVEYARKFCRAFYLDESWIGGE